MARVPAPYRPAPSSRGAARERWMAAVEAVCAELAERGYRVRIVDVGPPDESDPRLAVRAPQGDREVELFGGCDVLIGRGRWFAACVSTEDRSVWQGPRLVSSATRTADFVESLLRTGDCSLGECCSRLA